MRVALPSFVVFLLVANIAAAIEISPTATSRAIACPANCIASGETCTCPTPACVSRVDEQGCIVTECAQGGSRSCPTNATACSKPACDGAVDTGNKDENGCAIYSCPVDCPQLTPPAPNFCPKGKIVPLKNADGCITGYDCVAAACTMPACAGAAPTGEKDANGCPIYSCPAQPACKDLYWYDSTHKECGQKQFCGAYMYLGLRTFDTKGACLASLNSGSTCARPACEGAVDTGRKDENGCAIFACPAKACSIPRCRGAQDTGMKDANGCPIYACSALPCPANCVASGGTCTCPTNSTSTCKSHVDERGCTVVECADGQGTTTCPSACVPPCTQSGDTCTCPAAPVEKTVAGQRGRSAIRVEPAADHLVIKEGAAQATTAQKLAIENDTLLLLNSAGKQEVKVMPSAASETALNQLRLKEYQIELKDVGKPVYEITGTKSVKILGLFNAEMRVSGQLDAQTGALESVQGPWWRIVTTG